MTDCSFSLFIQSNAFRHPRKASQAPRKAWQGNRRQASSLYQSMRRLISYPRHPFEPTRLNSKLNPTRLHSMLPPLPRPLPLAWRPSQPSGHPDRLIECRGLQTGRRGPSVSQVSHAKRALRFPGEGSRLPISLPSELEASRPPRRTQIEGPYWNWNRNWSQANIQGRPPTLFGTNFKTNTKRTRALLELEQPPSFQTLKLSILGSRKLARCLGGAAKKAPNSSSFEFGHQIAH